jgi:hypothetical protein
MLSYHCEWDFFVIPHAFELQGLEYPIAEESTGLHSASSFVGYLHGG